MADLWTEAKVSPPGKLNEADVKRWLKNFAIFASPLLLIFLAQLQAGVSVREALPILYGALIQALMDLIRKFQDGSR